MFGALFMLMQFVFSPVQGALSDRYGRRTVILISSFGLGIDFVVMALAPSLWLLFVGRAISGMCAASFSTANAYIADITPKEKRAAAFGTLGAAFGIGFIIGPALGGFLGHLWIRLPFWIAAVLSLINFAYGLFVLPESLPKEKRSARFDWRHANPFGALVLLRRYPQVFGLAAVFFLINLAQFSLNSTYVLYTDYRYGWGPQAVGYTLALVGLCSGLVQAVLVRRLMPKLWRAPADHWRTAAVYRRLPVFRIGQHRGLDFPAWHSVPVPGWLGRTASTGDDDPAGRSARTRAVCKAP
jgi:DHA1 family tetracycline resistance protein-like MFS transporter